MLRSWCLKRYQALFFKLSAAAVDKLDANDSLKIILALLYPIADHQWGARYQGPLLLTCTSTPTWISNHMPSKMWDEITYPFPNFWSLGMDKQFHPTLYNGCNYLFMLGLKLMKRAPGVFLWVQHLTCSNIVMIILCTFSLDSIILMA